MDCRLRKLPLCWCDDDGGAIAARPGSRGIQGSVGAPVTATRMSWATQDE